MANPYIGLGESSSNPYVGLGADDKIDKPENVLQKAVRMVSGSLSRGVKEIQQPYDFAPGYNPFGNAPGMNSFRFAQGAQQGLIDETVKNPAGNLGLSIATDPTTYAGGGLAHKLGAPVRFFGNYKAGRKIADKAYDEVDKVFTKFDSQYDKVLGKSNAQYIPRDKIATLQKNLADIGEKLPEGSPGSKLLQEFYRDSSGMTAQELHTAKRTLFKKSKNMDKYEKSLIRDAYNEVSDTLGEVFGGGYKKVTSEFKDFMQNEFNYVEDNIMDSMGKTTEKWITARSPLYTRETEAFNRLGNRSGFPFTRKIKAIKRGQNIKKGLPILGRFFS